MRMPFHPVKKLVRGLSRASGCLVCLAYPAYRVTPYGLFRQLKVHIEII